MKVRLYVRVTLPDGSRQYLDPVRLGNGALKRGWGIHQGCPQRFDDFGYYLRYVRQGKRVWESVGDDPALALTAKRRTELQLRAAAEGIALQPASPQGTEPAPGGKEPPVSGRSLRESIEGYLTEIREHKSKKTLAAYTRTLRFFEESLGRKARTMTIEDISRADALTYTTFLRKRGNSPRTMRNRVDYLQVFLHHFGLPSVLTGKDKPKATDKKPRVYSAYELGLMFGVATVDEADLLHFFLGTGVREQEAQFACWPDVDLHEKTYRITEHREMGFTPQRQRGGHRSTARCSGRAAHRTAQALSAVKVDFPCREREAEWPSASDREGPRSPRRSELWALLHPSRAVVRGGAGLPSRDPAFASQDIRDGTPPWRHLGSHHHGLPASFQLGHDAALPGRWRRRPNTPEDRQRIC